jgi:hypothetical protein
MSDTTTIAPRFSRASAESVRSPDVQARLDEAMRRMDKRFRESEPSLTQTKYRDLITKQGNTMEFKPSFAQDNPADRLWKAAKFQVKQDHHMRCSKIMKVAQRMMGKDRGLEVDR